MYIEKIDYKISFIPFKKKPSLIVAHNMMCVNAQLCPPLCDPIECNLPGSSISEIFQAKILERVAISSSRGSFRSRDGNQGRFFTTEPPGNNTEVLPNPGSYVRGTVRPNKHKHRGLDQTKVYFRAPSKKNRWLMLKRPNLKDGFQERVFKGKIRDEGYRVCDFLLADWWWGKRVIFLESRSTCGSNQSGVYILVVSLQTPSSTPGGILISVVSHSVVSNSWDFPGKSRVPFPSPEDVPSPGVESPPPTQAGGFFATETHGTACRTTQRRAPDGCLNASRRN